jgi:hypothetical protein
VIYDFPASSSPIRQGDIFQGIPRVELSLGEISVINERNEVEALAWEAVRTRAEPVTAVLAVRPVWAIVMSQDCDTVRAPDLTLCEIKRFGDVVRVPEPTTPKKWTSLIISQATANWKWFYLPPNAQLGFAERMAADFLATIRVPRQGLEGAVHLRRGRLNEVADEHFRERLADFYRRYPYNEWYPFSKDEFSAYREGHPQESSIVLPYGWQK